MVNNQVFPLWDFLNSNKYKYRVYIFLSSPRTPLAIGYQLALGLLIAVDIILTVFMSRVDSVISYWSIFGLDLAITIIFGLEHFVRVWASTCLPKFRGIKGFLYMLVHPTYLLDIFVLGTTIAVLVFDVRESLLAVGLRGFRMLHFFENRYHLWRIIGHVVWAQRFQLAVVTYFCIVWLFIVAFMMYFIEAPYNPQFSTVANSLWFTMVTFTTVGYGDVAPISTPGKIITSIGMIVGVSIFALPGGVIGAGLALRIEEEDSKPASLKQQLAAAMVQDAWRLYVIRKRYLANPNIVVSMTPSMRAFRFSAQTSTSGPYLHPQAAIFVYKLRYLLSRKRFQFSLYLCDSNTFYETYTRNTLNYSNVIKDMQTQIQRMEDTGARTNQLAEALYSMAPTLTSNESQENGAQEKPKKNRQLQCKCRCSGVTCWRCLQRRRIRRRARARREENEP